MTPASAPPLHHRLLSAPATDGRCSLSNLGSNLGFFELVIRSGIQPGRALGNPDEGTWILTAGSLFRSLFLENVIPKRDPQVMKTVGGGGRSAPAAVDGGGRAERCLLPTELPVFNSRSSLHLGAPGPSCSCLQSASSSTRALLFPPRSRVMGWPGRARKSIIRSKKKPGFPVLDPRGSVGNAELLGVRGHPVLLRAGQDRAGGP